jgi:hypothetical protein
LVGEKNGPGWRVNDLGEIPDLLAEVTA